MIHIRAIEKKFDGNVDRLDIQTLAGVFTIEELHRNSQPGQIVISSDYEIEVFRDGNSVIIGTREGNNESV